MPIVELEGKIFSGVVGSIAFVIWKARENIFRQRDEINRLRAENEQLEQLVLQHQSRESEHLQTIAALTATHAQAMMDLEQAHLNNKIERDRLHDISIRQLRRANVEALREQAAAYAEGRVSILPKEMRKG